MRQPRTTAKSSGFKPPWGWEEGGIYPSQPRVWLSTLSLQHQFASQRHAGVLGQTPVSSLGIERPLGRNPAPLFPATNWSQLLWSGVTLW